MNINRLAVSVALGLVVASASGRAEAKNLPYKGNCSGSITSTEIDPNGDGQKTGLIIGDGLAPWARPRSKAGLVTLSLLGLQPVPMAMQGRSLR